MSNMGTQGRDLNADPGIRGHIEALSLHNPAPDVDLSRRRSLNVTTQSDRASEDGKEVWDIKDLKPEDRLSRLEWKAHGVHTRPSGNAAKPMYGQAQGKADTRPDVRHAGTESRAAKQTVIIEFTASEAAKVALYRRAIRKSLLEWARHLRI